MEQYVQMLQEAAEVLRLHMFQRVDFMELGRGGHGAGNRPVVSTCLVVLPLSPAARYVAAMVWSPLPLIVL